MTVIEFGICKELEIESSKAILNNDDLEVIVMYLENKKRSKFGFDIDDYYLIDKYRINIKFENVDDKLKILNFYDNNYLDDLFIKNFNLTLNLPLDDLISRQEDKYEKDNRVLLLLNVPARLKNDDNTRELFVDYPTRGCDECLHESMSYSKIFSNCLYVRYNTDFNRELVMEEFKSNPRLEMSDYLFAYVNLNYLFLRVTGNQNVDDVVDFLKENYQFDMIRSIRLFSKQLLLLEFQNRDKMRGFMDDNSEKYIIEFVYNLELINSCYLIKDDKVKSLKNIVPTAAAEIEFIIEDYNENTQLFSIDDSAIDDLKVKLNELNVLKNLSCFYLDNKLIVKFISNNDESKTIVEELIKRYLNEEYKCVKIEFNFKSFISNENEHLIEDYMNEIRQQMNGFTKISIKSTDLKNGFFEIDGRTASIHDFSDKINSKNKYSLNDTEIHKNRILLIDPMWSKLKDFFGKNRNGTIKQRPKELLINFKGALIDILFLISYAKSCFNKIKNSSLTLTNEQIKQLEAIESDIVKTLKLKKLLVVIDFSDSNVDNLKLYSFNDLHIENARRELDEILSKLIN